MGAVAMLLWALALLSIAPPAISDPHYLVAFPAIIRHPNTEKFCILLRSLPETVHLAVTLEMQTQNRTLVEKNVEKPGTFECINFRVPPFVPTKTQLWGSITREEVAHVHVLIRKGDSVSFEGRKKVSVRDSNRRRIIEPDKPFYKPGDTVKFRIVTLDEDFKAIEDVIPLIQLKDPSGNRIGQWADEKPQQGVLDLSFPLSSEAPLGIYSLQVGELPINPWNFEDNMLVFTVEEYVLPKCEVSLEVPELITTSDEELWVKVLGRYTYGKPVRGNVHLTVGRDIPYYFFEEAFRDSPSSIHKEYTGQTDKTGYACFTINATDFPLNQTSFENTIQLVAKLEEEGTGATCTARGEIAIVTRTVEVEFVNLNPFYKEGFPYTGKMHFSVSGVPIKNQTVYLTVDVNEVEEHFPYVTDEKGDAHFSLPTATWKDTMVALRGRYSIFNTTHDDLAGLYTVFNEAFRWLKPFYSESNSFLEIQSEEDELPCEKDQDVLVDYILDRKELDPEADHVDFYYLIVSKGTVVINGQMQVPIGPDETLKGTFSLTLPISADLAPTARLLLFAVFADGEVAADVEVFPIEKCFQHKVTLGFSAEEELPGSKVNLQVKAAPGALCSLHAVDKSVTLKWNATLTPDKVYRQSFFFSDTIGTRGFDYHLEDFEPYPCLPSQETEPRPRQRRSTIFAPWYQSQGDVYSLFQQLCMKLFTNTKVKKPLSCDMPYPERRVLKLGEVMNAGRLNVSSRLPFKFGPPGAPMAIAERDSDSTSATKKESAKPRTHFPETWVWDLVPVNEEGKATHALTVPDTITEWNAHAFCVADLGFGLSQQATLRVFQPFFVALTLPYSVVRGETFQLKATAFNYLKECIQVRVSLGESQELEANSTCHSSACLCEDEAKTFSWNVTATHLGRVNVSVTAEAEESHALCGNQLSVTPERGRSDTVIKSLLVKAEGVLEEEAHNVFLCSSGDPAVEDVSLKLPEPVVEDSGRATVSAIGDIMGNALQHIDQLLQLPFGCGEQNMVKFVPNIFVLRYLEKTNQATPEIKNKAIEFMKTGYQRQLLYKHDNGSYSAFGKRDPEGNTWLTAFVARAFGQAKSYISIDDVHLQDAIRWLGQHQRPTGCFQSVGRLFNNALKGNVGDELSLTAYVTTAMLELHLNDSAVEDALRCLKQNLSSVEDLYTKALSAYAFTLAGDHEMRQQLLRELLDQADKDEGSISFSDTETTAYLLLALLAAPDVPADDLKLASQVVRALAKRQNPYGGFQSTQDTVIALQALSPYAGLTFREIKGLKVLVKSGRGFQHEFHVDKANRLLLQQASLPEVPGQYTVEVSGSGCAYVQTTLRYNKPPEKKDVFALEVETAPRECNETSRKQFDIHLKVSYTGHRQTSNMALIELNLLSGFIPVKKSVKGLEHEPRVKKVELEPDKIILYLDWLDESVQSYSVSVKQDVEVTDLKPATVRVYDYYHPEDNVVVEYNAPCSTDPLV